MTDPVPPGDDVPENEVMRETRRAREQAAKAEAAEAGKTRKKQMGWKTGVGIGVGSAALLAALMYANRKRD
jgi:hypothetical protein